MSAAQGKAHVGRNCTVTLGKLNAADGQEAALERMRAIIAGQGHKARMPEVQGDYGALHKTLGLMVEAGTLTTLEVTQRGPMTREKANNDLNRLRRLGYVTSAGRVNFYRVWHITDAGREFAEQCL
ncbi:hypothetical protein [Thioclava kandeliae]|uniref:MarR family transcriptional regulator n=1 Tax=Thioclava kandeliae TaxID=3070818 RepID=A0ABV1SFT0_9RHOB